MKSCYPLSRSLLTLKNFDVLSILKRSIEKQIVP